MNTLTFVGKIEYMQLIPEGNYQIAQVIFIEKHENVVNYIPCLIPHRVLEEFEDHIDIGTILEVSAHLDYKTTMKDGSLSISQKIIIDKMAYFELNEDIVSLDVKALGDRFFDNKIIFDVPF